MTKKTIVELKQHCQLFLWAGPPSPPQPPSPMTKISGATLADEHLYITRLMYHFLFGLVYSIHLHENMEYCIEPTVNKNESFPFSTKS